MELNKGKTEKWKTETGIFMYNYGRNIALKLAVVEATMKFEYEMEKA